MLNEFVFNWESRYNDRTNTHTHTHVREHIHPNGILLTEHLLETPANIMITKMASSSYSSADVDCMWPIEKQRGVGDRRESSTNHLIPFLFKLFIIKSFNIAFVCVCVYISMDHYCNVEQQNGCNTKYHNYQAFYYSSYSF